MTTPISVQLYSLREEAERDLTRLVQRLGEIGFLGIEPAGTHGLRPAEFRSLIESAGMQVCSAHGPLPLGDDANRILDDQQELGNSALIVPYLPVERFQDRDAVRGTAEDLNRAWENVNARGMSLGYHNHWWEFQARFDGKTAYDVLFEALRPEIFAEVDTYWARVGGVDPAALISQLGARTRYLHIKDGPADDPGAAMVAVGDGRMDVASIVRAGSGVSWHVVELDRCETDMLEAVARSYDFLVKNGLSRGRV
jgi:sugar phosphate isomerase/epimerase